MQEFTAKYANQIQGTLSGFDRLVFRGSLRKISYPFGMAGFLWAIQVPFTRFGRYVEEIRQQVKEGAVQCVAAAGRPVQYLQSSKEDKEAIARGIALRDKVASGPVCALTCVEPCWGFDIYRNAQTRQLDLVQRSRKCLYVYQYWEHPVLGWMNARIQTWFPFSIQICMNGREWLARQMDAEGIEYTRHDNCFPWISHWQRAQELADAQRQVDWPKLLGEMAGNLNPFHQEIFEKFPLDYYWSVYQSEWATDISFRKAEDLERLYPLFVYHAMTTFRSPDILRFLGKPLTKTGEVNGHCHAEVTSDLKKRREGVRIKHCYHDNSVKLYDKAYTERGAVLRPEVTIQSPEEFLVYRRSEGDEDGPLRWLPMRQGIADLHQLAEVAEKVNQRYLNALAAVDDSTSLGELLEALEKRVEWNGKWVRALRPFEREDGALLKAVAGGEFLIHGFRNKDLQPLLYESNPTDSREQKRRSAVISRKLRLLRAHGLIQRIPKTFRYKVTPRGRQVLIALFTACRSTVQQLIGKAA
jgi:hypothetical protein